MNYIEEAEKVLKDHKKLLDSIDNLKARRERIIKKGVPKEVKSIDYSKPTIQHQDYSEDTINQICEIATINKQINETEEEMKIVQNILKQIENEDKQSEKFLRIKYLENPKEPLRKIAGKMGYSEESNHTIYDIKAKALRQFAILYFGVTAQKNT